MNFDSPAGSGGKTEEIRRLCSDSIHEFESALDDNMNTALALSVFMRFVNEINSTRPMTN